MDYGLHWAAGTAAADYIRLLGAAENLIGRVVDIQGIQKHQVEDMASSLGTDLKKNKHSIPIINLSRSSVMPSYLHGYDLTYFLKLQT